MKSALLLGFPCALVLLASSLTAHAEDLGTELMKATFKLANEKSSATAFLLCRPNPDAPKKTQYLLVTAAHAFETMSGNEATLFLRRHEAEDVYKKVPVKLAIRKAGTALWTKHPSADVAVMPVVPPEDCDVPRLPVDLLASDKTLKKQHVHPGDSMLFLGYPHRIEANEAGFPILRSGTLATFPLTPTRKTKTFLLSGNTFEGDSGGPVCLAESKRSAGEKDDAHDGRYLVGLVVGQHFLDEEARMIYGATKMRHRLGLAIVVHATFIKETIDRLPRSP
jgi:hypothetical protein